MRGRSRAILYVSKLDRYFSLTGVITQARATLVHGTCQRRAAACTMSSFSEPVTITGSRPGVLTLYVDSGGFIHLAFLSLVIWKFLCYNESIEGQKEL